MKYPEKFLLKLPEGTLGRVDAVADNRSEWIRGLVLRELGADGVGKTEVVGKSHKPDAADRKLTVFESVVLGKKNSTAGASKQKADQARVALRAAENAKRNYDDDAFLLDFLKCGVRTERQIAKEIRWPEMRVSKAVARLGAAGKVKFSGGGIEVI